jgi:histidine triad (HIT) family protein
MIAIGKSYGVASASIFLRGGPDGQLHAADLIGPFFRNVQLLASGVERGMEAEGTFVAINNRVSQSVPHLHVHIVPRRKKDGLRGFFWPRQTYQDEARMKSAQMAIRNAIAL